MRYDYEETNKVILDLEKQIADFKSALEKAINSLEYAAYNLCEQTVDEIDSEQFTIESTCPERTLLIALRDLKLLKGRKI